MTITCDEFAVTGGKGVKHEWQNAKPRPLYLNADEVESVWEQ